MNRLARASSPYLLAHATQPVDWHPWGDTAFELARRQDRPILLSIGYASCHWCQTMANESFSDPACAERLNRHFVCIKLDREEHPEVDEIYQKAHQLLARKPGGWPLTAFLTPAGLPFYSGNYYPAEARYGLPAFTTVLEKVSRAWLHQRKAIGQQTLQLRDALKLALTGQFEPATGALENKGVRKCIAHLLEQFDAQHGGFGSAPKFPCASQLEFLLHAGVLHNVQHARHAALYSLRKMAEGGLHDHLGGGFFRYCSDPAWQLPHFEKFLKDNALLLWLYCEAAALTGETVFRRAAQACAEWMLREMRTSTGSFCHALDGGSLEQPGQTYLWKRAEISSQLQGERLALVSAHFGLDEPASDPDAQHLLRVTRPLEEVAGTLAIPPVTALQHLDVACQRLLELRSHHPQPLRDEQVLTADNAFAIRALARGAQVFQRGEWLDAARRALAALLETNRPAGQWLTCSHHGTGGPPALLEDHAALLCACLELLQAHFHSADLELACSLADALLAHFEDAENGGFYSTPHEAPPLIARARPIHDGPHPAGNPLAARSLLRLGHLLAEPRYLSAAERCLRAFHARLEAPEHASSLALLLQEWLTPPVVVILRGHHAEARHWQAELRSQCHPDLLCLHIPSGLTGLPAVLDKAAGSATTAWICRGARCLPPVDNLPALLETIRPESGYAPECWMHSSLVKGLSTT